MANNFKFVTLTHPGEVKSQSNQALIRAHAIRGAIRRERRNAAERQENFVAVMVDPEEHRLVKRRLRKSLEKAPSLSKMDPFDSLPQCPDRLRVLMRHKNAKQAGEPIFCVGDTGKIFFQDMEAIFQGALSDLALFHALSLSLALAANEDKPNIECLTHRGEALKEISQRISFGQAGQVVQPSTLSAILLLIGYEYRVDGASSSSVGLHLDAIDELVRLCNKANVIICAALRRAMFWQDLMSCFLVGTKRCTCHQKIPELNWSRDPGQESLYYVPPGFNPVIWLFPQAMISLLEDLNALCMMLDARCTYGDLPINKFDIDNGQAWIESQLVNIMVSFRAAGDDNPIYEACIYASYACTYKLSTSIWEGSLMPAFCASQILHIVQKVEAQAEWRLHAELLLWLLFVGGSFAGKKMVRLHFIALILGPYRECVEPLHAAWPEAERVLTTFVWSKHVMSAHFRKFWEEIHPNRGY